jgi:hypothetical protein
MKKRKTKQLYDGQLLLTVTDERQTRPLVREGSPQRQASKFHIELISGRKSHTGLDTKSSASGIPINTPHVALLHEN